MEFVCRIGTPQGEVREEVHDSRDETTLKAELEGRGYHVFEVRPKGLLSYLALPALERRRKRIPSQELLVFNQELAALLRAGLPLLQSLDLMLERMKHPEFRRVLTDVRDRVKSGSELSDAFEAHGEAFPPLYASTLRAGERSGELEAVIRRFIRYLSLVLDTRKRVFTALVYPFVLVGLSLAMILVMTVYVIPRFREFYADLGSELPALTQATLGLAQFIRGNWFWLLIGAAATAFALLRWRDSESGARTLDRWKLRLPLLGDVFHRFSISEFCRSLSTLLAGGTPLVPALEIAVRAVGNAHVRSHLQPVIEKVREGRPFHTSLEESGVFTDLGVDMVQVGEATGALDEMLANVADLLDDQVETRMRRILSLLEPLLLVVMGLVVAILLLSVYLPMFSALGDLG